MNEKEIIAALGKGATADAPAHEAHVRHALLSSHKKTGFAMPRNFLTYVVMNKYSVPATALGVVALALVFNFAVLDPSTVSAQELAQRAYTRAIKISPEMRAQLEAKMKADMLETLAEAKAAPDLRVLTPEEFKKESPFTISTSTVAFTAQGNLAATGVRSVSIAKVAGAPMPIEGKPVTMHMIRGEAGVVKAGAQDVVFNVAAKPAQLHAVGGSIAVTAGATDASGAMTLPPEPVKYLSYTDPKGNKVMLGLDKDDTPIFKFAELKDVKMIEGVPSVMGTPALKPIHFEEVTE